MNLRNAAGASLSRFAHLAGLSSQKAASKAEDDDQKEDKKDDDEEDDKKDAKAEDDDDDKKKDAKADDDGDDDDMDANAADDDEEDDDDKEKKDAKSARAAERRRSSAIARAAGDLLTADLIDSGMTAAVCKSIIREIGAVSGGASRKKTLSDRMTTQKDIRVGEDATRDGPTTPAAEASAQASRILALARANGGKF